MTQEKPKQNRSCDLCRMRKVKCDGAGLSDPSNPSQANPGQPCTSCKEINLPCTYDYQPKRRGPKRKSRTLPGTSQSPVPLKNGAPLDNRPSVDGGATRSWQRQSIETQGSIIDAPSQNIETHSVTFPPRSPPSSSVNRILLPELDPTYINDPSNPFDNVLPRVALYHIINLYLTYVYPLIPLVHCPSFLADIINRREEHPDEEEFVAMVFSMIAVTLCQVPDVFVSMPKAQIKDLVQRCYGQARRSLNKDVATCTIARQATLYFTSVACSLMGHTVTHAQITGSNFGLIVFTKMNRDETYSQWDPIERELRRRVFWLHANGNICYALINQYSLLFSDEDLASMSLPQAIDDEIPPKSSAELAPAVAGFCYTSKLLQLCGNLVQKYRSDTRAPPSGLWLELRIGEIGDLIHKIQHCLDDCPPALKLLNSGSPITQMNDWLTSESDSMDKLLKYLGQGDNPSDDGFQVVTANLHVSHLIPASPPQAMVRHFALQYREWLYHLQDAEAGPEVPVGFSIDRLRESEQERDDTIMGLLKILRSIPLRVIAVNSTPIIVKVRQVASTLLTSFFSEQQQSNQGEVDSVQAERSKMAQSWLFDFLKILSEIEALCAFSGEQGRTS